MIKPQKVLHYHIEEAKKNPKIQGEYIVSEKLDGWFTTISYNTKVGWLDVKSSNGRTIPSMKHAKQFFERLPVPDRNITLIAEAYIPEMDFYTMNGIFNRSKGECQATDVEFYIHDLVYNSELSNDIVVDKRPALERMESISWLALDNNTKIRGIKPYTVTKDREIWFDYFDRVTYKGGEGVILKQADGLYQPEKRNSSLMKMKLEDTYDLLCIDMYLTYGEKGNENLNILLKDKAGTEQAVRVGKHEDVYNFMNVESPVGKVVEIKVMKKNEDGSYREPRFVTVRRYKSVSEID